MKRVLICGSRSWDDRQKIRQRVAELPPGCIVIHGGALGADSIAGEEAHAAGLHTAVVRPLWGSGENYDRAAGHKRNSAMLDLLPDLVIAFTYGTPGTAGTVREAQRRGIAVEILTGSQTAELA